MRQSHELNSPDAFKYFEQTDRPKQILYSLARLKLQGELLKYQPISQALRIADYVRFLYCDLCMPAETFRRAQSFRWLFITPGDTSSRAAAKEAAADVHQKILGPLPLSSPAARGGRMQEGELRIAKALFCRATFFAVKSSAT
jgi:hypothetical protein